MNEDYLFVYGTLMQNGTCEERKLLDRFAEFLGYAFLQAKLFRIGSYPGAVPSGSPGDRVRGEVYRIRSPDPVLEKLDRYEGCGKDTQDPPLFVRKKMMVHIENGGHVPVWVYLYNRNTEGLIQIESWNECIIDGSQDCSAGST